MKIAQAEPKDLLPAARRSFRVLQTLDGRFYWSARYWVEDGAPQQTAELAWLDCVACHQSSLNSDSNPQCEGFTP